MTYADDLMPLIVLSCSVFLITVSIAVFFIVIVNISIRKRIKRRREYHPLFGKRDNDA